MTAPVTLTVVAALVREAAPMTISVAWRRLAVTKEAMAVAMVVRMMCEVDSDGGTDGGGMREGGIIGCGRGKLSV